MSASLLLSIGPADGVEDMGFEQWTAESSIFHGLVTDDVVDFIYSFVKLLALKDVTDAVSKVSPIELWTPPQA